MLAAGVAAGLGQLVGLGPVDPALVGEEQDPVVGRGDEEVVDDVVGAQLRRRGTPLPPRRCARYRSVLVRLAYPPWVIVTDDVLLGDQVLVGHLAVVGDDLGAPLVAELGDDLAQLVADDLPLPRRARPGCPRGRRSCASQVVPLVDPAPAAPARPACAAACRGSRVAWISSMSSSPIRPGCARRPPTRVARISAMTSSIRSMRLEQRGHDVQPLPRPCAAGTSCGGR